MYNHLLLRPLIFGLLLAGRTMLTLISIYAVICLFNKVILCYDYMLPAAVGLNTHIFQIANLTARFALLFDSYSFPIIIFIKLLVRGEC